MNDTTASQGSTVKLVYVLYLVSLLVGITGLIGLIMAYVNKSEASDVEAAHYRYQIRTFWIGLLYAFVGALTAAIGIGILILLFVLVWWIIRCVKGLSQMGKNQPPENVASWLF